MRTDSTNVADSALREASAYVKEKFGASFTPKTARQYTKRVAARRRPTRRYVRPPSSPNRIR